MNIKSKDGKTAKRNIIDWDTRFKLNISLIDRQHHKLVQLTNSLHNACLESPETANRSFIETVREAVNYVRFHFSTEEKLMRLIDFPGYTAHKKEHENFIKEVLTHTEKFNQTKFLVPNRFVLFLKEWILSHIAVCDKEMADSIIKTKYHEKLEQLFSESAA